MTLLTKSEINKFRGMIGKRQYTDVLTFGQKLLKKDESDGAGIRYGVLSACAVLGNVAVAENITKCSVFFGEGREMPGDTWLDEVESGMAYTLAMTYWKVEEYDKAKRALRNINDDALKQFIELDEKGLAGGKSSVAFGYFLSDINELFACVDMDWSEMQEFNRWIRKMLIEQ